MGDTQLRYPLKPHRQRRETSAWDPERLRRWLPVDQYVGGPEHAVMHLLYVRFFTRALYRLGHIDFEEPFTHLIHQGVITSQGARMSKSRGNVILPEPYVEEFGSDTLRTYLMFGFSYSGGGEWDPSGIQAMFRYLSRVHRFLEKRQEELQ